MTYRAIFTGDIHCSNNSLPYAKKDPNTLISDRLMDTVNILNTMGTYASHHEISDIWIVGDLIDKQLIDAVTLKVVSQHLQTLAQDFRVRLIPGNHEAYDGQARHYTLDAFGSFSSDIWVASPEQPEFQDCNGIRFLCVPYGPEERVRRMIKQEAQVLLLHQTIVGAKQGKWVSPDGIEPELFKPFRTVLAGHFHTPQTIIDPIHYLGAPLQHHFGDAGEERGFWDVTFAEDGTMVKRDMIIPTVPKFHEVSLDNIIADGYEYLNDVVPDDYVHIRVEALESDMPRRLREATEIGRKLMAERGVRYVRALPKPVQQQAQARLDVGSTVEMRQSWPKMISQYLSVCDVTGLNRERLENIAKSLIEEAL